MDQPTYNFDKQQYLKEQLWLKNDYLMTPPGIKKCECCQQKFYSIEFADNNLFVDGKLPVCTECFRSRKKTKDIKSVLEGYTKQCKKCEQIKPIFEFSISSTRNELQDTCRDCGRKAFEGKLNK